MTAPVTEIARLVQQESGIVVPPAKEYTLRAALRRAAPGLAPQAFLHAIGDPARRPELLDRLIDEVTVQETTFVRDREQLDSIDWRGLQAGLQPAGGGTIRVWSAGCATGEEPYTLALLATEAFAPAVPPVAVLGTDISQGALAAAVAGRYRQRAVRGLGGAARRRYFERQDDGTYLVRDTLRRLVRFRLHNLARDAYPPAGEPPFDLVVCRNVLIYFPAALAGRVIRGFEQSLRPGGTLMLGAADALQRPDRAAPGPRPGRLAAVLQPAGAAPPAPPAARLPREERLAAAVAAADVGDHSRAAGLAASLLADDPLDADAYFLQGLVALDDGDAADAVNALRRALYADATFALAAFALGRAYDALGDPAAARRAYRQALGLLDPDDHRHDPLLQQVDIGDIAAACRARLGGRS